ncbi:hypothetical protein D3C80_1800680 [compost metagenome]
MSRVFNEPLLRCGSTITLGSMPIIGPLCSTWRKVCMEMVSMVLRGSATWTLAKASSMRPRIGVPLG